MVYKIALTGGIGSGKTTAANVFRTLNVPVISTDSFSRELVLPNTDAYHKIVAKFGCDILVRDKSIDRRKMRDLIFTSNEHKKWLESLLHPMILQGLKNRMGLVTANYCIVEIPLLIDPEFIVLFDRILLIDCDEALQIQRASIRDNCDEAIIKSILDTQPSRKYRSTIAHDIISNEGSIDELESKIRSYYAALVKHD